MSKQKEQSTFKLHKELGGLEMVEASFHNMTFSKHCHENYTINVIEKGTQSFLSSGKKYIAPVNSIILVNSDTIHTGQSAEDGGWSYRGIAPQPIEFSKLAEDLGHSIDFIPYFPESVITDPQMANELVQLFNILTYSDNKLLRETILNGVLTRLLIKYGKCPPKKNRDQNCSLALIREYIHDHLDQNISLDELAKLVNISAFALVKQFKKIYGAPPHAYQIQHRLLKSKSLLKNGAALANIAIELGFHDQSHFHRHFIKAYGVSPGKYSRQILLK